MQVNRRGGVRNRLVRPAFDQRSETSDPVHAPCDGVERAKAEAPVGERPCPARVPAHRVDERPAGERPYATGVVRQGLCDRARSMVATARS